MGPKRAEQPTGALGSRTSCWRSTGSPGTPQTIPTLATATSTTSSTAKEVAATPPGTIAVRMRNNRKGVYLRDSDASRAAHVMGRLVRLGADDPRQRRDPG